MLEIFDDDGVCRPSRILCCLEYLERGYGASMYLIGPIFVLCGMTLVVCVSYAGFIVLLPIRAEAFSPKWWIILIIGLYFLFNIVFHYTFCVVSNSGTHDSTYFDRAIKEARNQGITLLYEKPKEQEEEENDVLSKYQAWLRLDPFEWSYCRQTQGPKPPRSHYDRVTQKLVMNMDHYCPWMFNCVGYGNYRYFLSFLIQTCLATAYVAFLVSPLFMQSRFGPQRYHIAGLRVYINFTFFVCIAISGALLMMVSCHLYLVLSGQTTIEFWGNCQLPDRFKKGFSPPYSRGCKRNWQRVFGKMNPLWAVLVPSTRIPPWPPWPNPESTSETHTNTHVV